MPQLRSLQDKHQKARAWFGVGVALHMQQEQDTAIQAFQKAAKLAQVRRGKSFSFFTFLLFLLFVFEAWCTVADLVLCLC
jgi:hypothetical protein